MIEKENNSPPLSENTHYGSITTVQRTCFICLDSAASLMLNLQLIYLFGQTLTSQTGGQRHS